MRCLGRTSFGGRLSLGRSNFQTFLFRSHQILSLKRPEQALGRKYVLITSSLQRIRTLDATRVARPWDSSKNGRKEFNALSTISPFKCETIARRLGESEDYVDETLTELIAVFPDRCGQRLVHSGIDMLVLLLEDPEAIAKRMIALKMTLPGLDVWNMALDAPWLFDGPSVATLAAKLPVLK